ncbi:MAG: hypothetical protein HY744_23630, partial [Deltaproteobacteria bacterium]|nr:hypothetical protein [Deltaproteobacteria bacterium]
PCPDGNVCNGAESCDGNGACVPGTAPPVDDQNPCTADGCDPLGGVSHTPLPEGTPCGEGRICNAAAGCVEAAPPPDVVAPPIDPTTSSFFTQYSFLFSAPQPVQIDVAPGAITPRRAAVVRGRVTTCAGAPLANVKVRVADHPELGWTRTRSAGEFDLMVNGGGPLTVRYEAPGYVPVDRHVAPRWEDFAMLPDVVPTPYDSQVTAVDVSGAVPDFQVARASVASDADGSRQATLLFAPGTTAGLVTSCGGPIAELLPALHVRATELTVGACGERAMPSELPAQSFYTYAVELSADEAVATGAARVQFNQPAILYLDNFLNLPVGTPVPTGAYDRCTPCWTPSTSGRVIQILGVAGGVADIDVDGDLVADEGPAAALGITVAERAKLADLYLPGQSLWRVPVLSFSSWDCNLGGLPAGPAPAEDVDEPSVGIVGSIDKPRCEIPGGSSVDVHNRVLHESFEVVGTPYRLHYRSERSSARLVIPLTGASPPPNLKRVDLRISVAGRLFEHSFSAAPEQRFEFTWDGVEAYGRQALGPQPITTELAYVYDMIYQRVENFGSYGDGQQLVPARREYSLARNWTGYVAQRRRVEQLPSGFSIDAHHSYDARANVLYLGNGTRIALGDSARETQNDLARRGLGMMIETVAGTGEYGFSGDGGPAKAAKLSNVEDVAVGPDGTLYIADADNLRVSRVSPQGIISTYLTGVGRPESLALACDGALFIASSPASSLEDPRIYRNGQRWAGQRWIPDPPLPCSSESPDGTHALAVRICLGGLYGLAITAGPDCSVYYSELNAVMRIGPDQRVYRVAGLPRSPGFSGDGGPARLAQLFDPSDVALDGQGGLFIADEYNHRIRHVSNTGVITTVAGRGQVPPYYDSGDGGHARDATVNARFLARGPDGSVWLQARYAPLGNFFPYAIRRIDQQGIITREVGYVLGPILASCPYEDGCPALQEFFSSTGAMDFGPDGRLYFVAESRRVKAVSQPRAVPGSDIVIPSPDGGRYWVFHEVTGRHLRTHDALTNAVLYTYGYDGNGRLVTIRDADGRETKIARTAEGLPTTITSPFGQVTSFAYDGLGRPTAITNPAGETVSMTYYGSGSLMKTRTLPAGNTYTYTYDEQGLLIKTEDPAGGFKTFARPPGLPDPKKEAVTTTTALGRQSSYQVEQTPSGVVQTVMGPDGLSAVASFSKEATAATALPDGTTIDLAEGPDPRFGMSSPLPKTVTLKTGGKTFKIATEQTATLADPLDKLSLKTLTEKATVNGRVFTATFDGTGFAPKITRTTPAGRKTVTEVDAVGRPTKIQVASLVPTELAYYGLFDPPLLKGLLKSTSQGARKYEYFYDDYGNLQTVKGPLGKVVHLAHDAAGRVTEKTFPDGSRARFRYDPNGNLAAVAQPGSPPDFSPEQAHRLGFEPRDLLSSYLPPAIGLPSHETLFAYSLDAELDLVTRPDALSLDPSYDSAGRLSQLLLPGSALQYNYYSGAHPDSPGKLQTVANVTNNVSLAFTYKGGLLQSATWTGPVSGTLSFSYDDDLRVTGVKIGWDVIGYAYADADGLLTQAGLLGLTRDPATGMVVGSSIGYSSPIVDSLVHDGFGELTSYTAQRAGAYPTWAWVRSCHGYAASRTSAL